MSFALVEVTTTHRENVGGRLTPSQGVATTTELPDIAYRNATDPPEWYMRIPDTGIRDRQIYVR